ncbi:fungal specific transcription factor domain-containing protein [Aspergillus clavatus NRRL 1]|uniref:Xylanolytic transcriptional activator regulatory domain-containing protein n=1 Tax=Aspergillus clavatus (strain ATCC 1007 / CBS 513.65 / DSM 816 / NCTC 3887 / NRRL 1 / QM 1276 / 107) TaxID=344612 RepID=A1CU29_ASPCL|nr:uncharacterized protein ACLA_085110 [Aspergillus clavatus NRRL 1]EAW06816.1 predicted protein [Aspergillus clavatus NRRL 1]
MWIGGLATPRHQTWRIPKSIPQVAREPTRRASPAGHPNGDAVAYPHVRHVFEGDRRTRACLPGGLIMSQLGDQVHQTCKTPLNCEVDRMSQHPVYLLRDTVTQHIGPSQFSHNGRSEDMLETEAPDDAPSNLEDTLDPDQRCGFIRTCQIATRGFLYTMPDFDMTNTTGRQTGQDTMALTDVMIAIGAQTQAQNPTTNRIERIFFARGQRRAPAKMLESPSLGMVHLFLLMAFYMLGACRRNAAFVYLGVAARGAVALGLHADKSSFLPAAEQHRRYLLSHIDNSMASGPVNSLEQGVLSSILGRPPATSSLRSEYGASITEAPHPTGQVEGLKALYHLAHILDEIIARLYGEKTASAQVAESLLEKLKQWSDSLPKSLLTPQTRNRSVSLYKNLGRRLFVPLCSHRRDKTLPHFNPEEDVLGDIPENTVHTRLAVACTNSALYMLQTCLEIHRSELLLGNMCILRAFIFAAALVVGFSLFSQKDPNPDLEEALAGHQHPAHVLAAVHSGSALLRDPHIPPPRDLRATPAAFVPRTQHEPVQQ